MRHASAANTSAAGGLGGRGSPALPRRVVVQLWLAERAWGGSLCSCGASYSTVEGPRRERHRPPDDPFDGLRKLPEVCETLLHGLTTWTWSRTSAQTLNELIRTGRTLPRSTAREGKVQAKAKEPLLGRFAVSATLKWRKSLPSCSLMGEAVRLSRTLGILAAAASGRRPSHGANQLRLEVAGTP